MSHIQRPDGRLRLAATLMISMAAASTESLVSLWAMLALVSIATFLTALQQKSAGLDIAKRMLRINAFVVLVWLTVAIDWQLIELTDAGTELATQISLRVNIVTLAASSFLLRMNGVDLGRAAVGLGMSPALGALVAQVARQISLLSETKHRLELAMRARAYRKEFGLRTIRVNAQLVAWLLVHALARAERISLGLRARGVNATRWPLRDTAGWQSLPLSDWLTFGIVIFAIGFCILLPQLSGNS